MPNLATLTRSQFLALNREQQFYRILNALDETNGLTQVKFEHLRDSEKLFEFYRVLSTIDTGIYARLNSGIFELDDPRERELDSMGLVSSIPAIPGALTGFSDATYNIRTGTIFVVRNVPAGAGTTYELKLDGTIVRTITHTNFVDTESIEWIGFDFVNNADIFVYAEENATPASRASNLTICRLGVAATTLDRTAAGNVTVSTAYSNGTMANRGLESVAYDFTRGLIYYTAEDQTTAGSDNTPGTGNAKIFKRSITFSGALAFGAESVLCNINHLYAPPTSLTDISGFAYDVNSDTLLILSDENNLIVRIRLDGTVLETFPVTGTQPEGIAWHPDGTQMVIVGEPSEMYIYQMGVHRAGTVPPPNLFVKLPEYTVNSVPNAATAGPGAMIYVTDEVGGPTPAHSDGVVWMRTSDNNTISN